MKKIFRIVLVVLGVFATLFLLLVIFFYFLDLALQEEFRQRKGLVHRSYYVPQKVFLEKFTGWHIEESRYIKDVQALQPIMGPFTNATLFEASPEEIEKIVARFSLPNGHEDDWRRTGFPEYEIGKEKLVKCKHKNRYLDVTWHYRCKQFTRAEMENIIGKIELGQNDRESYYVVRLYYNSELSTAIISITSP